MSEDKQERYLGIVKSLEERLPWPKGVYDQAEQSVEKFLREGLPLYLSIGKQIDAEGEDLSDTIYADFIYKTKNKNPDEPECKKEEEQYILGAGLTAGYQEVFLELRWARMLEQSNGDIENHPDYIRFHGGQSGTQILERNDAVEEAEQIVRNKKMFDLITKDQSGISLLDFILKSKEEYLRKKEVNPLNNPSFIGLQHGVERYKELYLHFQHIAR